MAERALWPPFGYPPGYPAGQRGDIVQLYVQAQRKKLGANGASVGSRMAYRAQWYADACLNFL